MFFAPEGLQDSAQGFNPGKYPKKAVRPERARDQVGQMPPIATEKFRILSFLSVRVIACLGTIRQFTPRDALALETDSNENNFTCG
jgi:hypothetical protein